MASGNALCFLRGGRKIDEFLVLDVTLGVNHQTGHVKKDIARKSRSEVFPPALSANRELYKMRGLKRECFHSYYFLSSFEQQSSNAFM